MNDGVYFSRGDCKGVGGGGGGDYSTEVIISSNFPKGGRSFQGEIKRSGCFLRRHGTLADVVIVLCLHVLLAW